MIKHFSWFPIILLFLSCKSEENKSQYITLPADVEVAKWYNFHTAALTITIDSGNPRLSTNIEANLKILGYSLTADYEFVTCCYNESKLEYIYDFLLPNGFYLYGHGHRHIDHDELSYEEALYSFTRCYTVMDSLGFRSVAYAYPRGKGFEDETKLALKNAGFLSGRYHRTENHANPYILADSAVVEDWYGLPSLVMQDINYSNNEAAINNTDELIPYLAQSIEKKAWLILTYHAIGDTTSYGYYLMENFETDLLEISNRDFWVSSFNNITLYSLERLSVSVDVSWDLTESDPLLKLYISDGYQNDVYNLSLTVKVSIPSFWANEALSLYKDSSIISRRTANEDYVIFDILPDESVYTISP